MIKFSLLAVFLGCLLVQMVSAKYPEYRQNAFKDSLKEVGFVEIRRLNELLEYIMRFQEVKRWELLDKLAVDSDNIHLALKKWDQVNLKDPIARATSYAENVYVPCKIFQDAVGVEARVYASMNDRTLVNYAKMSQICADQINNPFVEVPAYLFMITLEEINRQNKRQKPIDNYLGF